MLSDLDHGVLLARIWLESDYETSSGRAVCRVIGIDDAPPYRRAFGPRECWPAETGNVNLGGLIWQRYEPGGEVDTRLKAYGITSEADESPHWTFERVKKLTDAVIYPRGSKLAIEVFHAGYPLGKRVVGFHSKSSKSTAE